MVLLICLCFGCGYWADLWRDCSQIRESCPCTWHSWLFVSSGRCWLKGRKIINTHYCFSLNMISQEPSSFSLSFFWEGGSFTTDTHITKAVVMPWILSTPQIATPSEISNFTSSFILLAHSLRNPLSGTSVYQQTRLVLPSRAPDPATPPRLHANPWVGGTIISCLYWLLVSPLLSLLLWSLFLRVAKVIFFQRKSGHFTCLFKSFPQFSQALGVNPTPYSI